VSGASSEGFRTIELPVAKAGAIFLMAINMGWFQAVSWTTTPRGTRFTNEKNEPSEHQDLTVIDVSPEEWWNSSLVCPNQSSEIFEPLKKMSSVGLLRNQPQEDAAIGHSFL
jgi:hypothetical protein